MLQTVLRSDDLLPEERLARFDEATGTRRTAGADREPEGIRYIMRTADLESVRVAELQHANALSRGGTHEVTPFCPGLCGIFQLSGSLPVAQDGRSVDRSGGEFTLYDTSQPAEIPFRDERDPRLVAFRHVRVFV